jgi:F-type H+-transporting ATPase subunit epsilon
MTVEVHLVTPEREVWVGDADSVVARGVDGEVGILAGHAPMMVQLAVGPLRVQRPEEPELVAVVDGGFMHVTSAADTDGDGKRGETRVDVLASHAELAADVDADEARRRLAELEERLEHPDGADRPASETLAIKREVAKARARVDVAG